MKQKSIPLSATLRIIGIMPKTMHEMRWIQDMKEQGGSKISVIIIEKDTREFMRKCLDSVASQTAKDLEIVVVDDHSQILSEDIVSEYSSNVNVRYYYLESEHGPGGARNFGIDKTTGELICFLDSDDWIDLDYLQKAADTMNRYQADIGMCGLVRNYEEKAYGTKYKCQYNNALVLDGTVAFQALSGQYEMGITINPSPVNKLYRRQYLLDHGIRFLENVYYEDILFAFQTLLSGCKVVTVPNTYYHHYRRNGSIVQSISSRHITDLITVFDKVRSYLMDNDLYEKYMHNYYGVFERFYNLLVRQVFQFAKTEEEKKHWLKESFKLLKSAVILEEYIEYSSAEDIRRHLQPYITDTALY